MDRLGNLAFGAFQILRIAWRKLGMRLVDYKVEGGMTQDTGELLIADVIDNDSWRLRNEAGDMSKQAYRDGEALDEVLRKFREVAELTNSFADPELRQEVMGQG